MPSNTPKSLTILVAACNEAGHLNACTGETLALKEHGHRVIFVLPESWRGRLAVHGFEEFVYQTDTPPKANEHPGEHNAKVLRDYKMLGPYSPKEKLASVVQIFNSEHHLTEIRQTDKAVKEAIAKFQPDAIIVDAHSLPPAVYYSRIPWIKSCSMAPSMEVWFDDVPPGGSGLPKDGDRSEWAEYNSIRRQVFASPIFSKLLVELGYKPFPNDIKFPETEILTVYAAPEEINFPQVRAKPGWFNLEAFNKVDPSQKEYTLTDLLSDEFIDNNLDGQWSGKYVYVSLGSMASVDVELMKRITDELKDTKHKYIISKGPRHGEFQLPKNMWGKDYLPQTKIIPLVDLVVTHGGNNTMTETFAQGIPMVVMPMFVDQYDNGTRLEETGYAVQVHPYTFQDKELRDAVEKVLADEAITKKCREAARRIQSTKRHEELALLIEKLLAK